MEEFIKILTEQIRCVKARDGVVKELIDHIQDQAECYEDSGMSHEEAMKAAVEEMGDPVAIGMELDHIHRPKTDWAMLLMVVIFSVLGIVILYITGVLVISPTRLGNQCLYTVIGLAVMFGIYYLDYSFIGKYAKWVCWGMFALYLSYILIWVDTVNGQARGMVMPSYLFIPVYAGILYQYRGQSYKAIVKSIMYMFPALYFSYFLIPSMPTTVNLFFIMSCMLLLAIWKGWFRLNRVKTILSLLFIGIVLPIGALSYLYVNLADYQQFRIQSFFQILKGIAPSSFINRCANTMIADSKWIGASIEMADSQYQLMVSNEFIITQLTAAYGMLFGLMVVLSLMMLMSHIFHITRKQKNQLGYMIGSGCGLIFFVMVIEGILVNLGVFPPSTICIPFLTYGSSATIAYDILLGLVLSVYRYQNILSDKSFLPKWKWKLSLKLEKTMRE